MKNFYSYKIVFTDGGDGDGAKLWSETKGTEYEFDTFHLEEFNSFLANIVNSHKEQYPEFVIVTIENVSLIHQETQSERTIHTFSSMLEEVKALCTIYLNSNKFKDDKVRKDEFYKRMMEWGKEYDNRRIVK